MKTKYLEEILNRLRDLAEYTNSETTIHKDWVQVVMGQFRQHLESLKIKSQYPILNFYCNWSLHDKLNQGIVQKILRKISGVINNPDAGHPADRISEILSLSHLRTEIIEVLNNQGGVKSGVFNLDKNWVAFTELMFPFLLDKPLKRTEKPQTKYWVESLSLFDNNGKLFWKIEVLPGEMTFTGPLVRVRTIQKM